MNKTINLDIYGCKVHFVLSDDIDKDIKRISKRNKVKFKLDYEVEGIVFYFDINEYYLLINSNYLTHNTLSHEIFHLVNKVTKNRDITDEESQAWLCGKITEDIYKHLNKNNIEIK
jgi:hypothetical protein